MFCSSCGKQVPDGQAFCQNCGARLAEVNQPTVPVPQPQMDEATTQQQFNYSAYAPSPQTVPEAAQPAAQVAVRQKKSKKPLFITLGALLLVAALAVGAYFLFFRKKNPLSQVAQAAAKTLDSLEEYTNKLPNLNKTVENSSKLIESDTTHLELHYRSASDDVSEVNATVDYDGDDGKLRLKAEVKMEGFYIPVAVYVDEEELQVSCDPILGQGKVLSLPLEDFGEAWNKSALPQMLSRMTDGEPVYLPDDFSIPSLGSNSLNKMMEKAYDDDWTDFYKSIKPEEVKGDSRFAGLGTTYQMTYDAALLERLASKAEQDLRSFRNLESPAEIRSLNLNRLLAAVMIQAYQQVMPRMQEEMLGKFYYCLNKDEELVGLFVQLGENKELELRLDGQSNPWEHILLTMIEPRYSWEYDSDESVVGKRTTQIDISTTVTNENMIFTATPIYDGQKDTDEQLQIIYRNSDGRILLDGEHMFDEFPEIYLNPVEGGFKAEVRGEIFSYNDVLSLEVSNNTGDIAKLSSSPTNVLKLSQEELVALVQGIGSAIDRID